MTDMQGGLGRRRFALPVQLTRFFGRELETSQLVELVRDVRVVTLQGAPGCGKTRLALEVAAVAADEFADAVCFVELAPIATDSAVAEAVARALGIAEQPQRSDLDTLLDALCDADLLLVLDNCEHVAEGVSELVSRLAQTCPSVRVLCTSRSPIRVVGEQIWPVPKLATDASTALFADRAELATGAFTLDDSNCPIVEKICDRLDSLPLAIELTAAWARVLSLSQIVERLDNALRLMSDGTHVTAERHETMEATVEWSYRLLAPAGQQLFEWLSVLAAGFDLAAVEAIAAAGPPDVDALRDLTSLVDHSLVVVDSSSPDTMYYSLLEPVRQVGAARLAERGETELIRQRHAEHYLEVACRADAELVGARRAQALRRMEQDQNNFRLALIWARETGNELGLQLASTLAHYLVFAARINEGRAWLEEMLDLPGANCRLRATGLARLGRLAWRQQDYARARECLEESLDIELAEGNELAAARRKSALALMAASEGAPNEALELCDEAIAVFRKSGDDIDLAWALITAGWAEYASDDIASGDECMWEALAARGETGDVMIAVQARIGLAYGANIMQNFAAQRSHLLKLREAFLQSGGIAAEPEWMWTGFRLAYNEGRPRAALRLAGGAQELGRSSGSRPPILLAENLTKALERLREQVGQGLFDRLEAQGAAMSLDELMAQAVAEGRDSENPLSQREAEVADLVGLGLSNVDIASKLFISRRTVESHLEHVRNKLGLASRHDVMAWVLDNSQDRAS